MLNLTPWQNFRRELWPQGPRVSTVGFGSYRIGKHPYYNFPECQQALERSLLQGMNLIDTSTNYADGESEELIGETLQKLSSSNQLKREDTVIVSKVGYVQGNNLEIAETAEKNLKPFARMAKFSGDLWHCIHPDWIRDQIERSLQRLQSSYVDVYLLHNPEYLLKKLETEGFPIQEARTTFYNAIKESFLCLEELVASKKIKAYGISSNTFGHPHEDPSSVSLRKCVTLAEEISPNHSFKVVQFPFNWIEVGPCFLSYDEADESALDIAQEKKLGVLINRPFNAMINNSLLRLTRPKEFSPEELSQLSDQEKNTFEGWKKLSSDLEKICKDLINVPGYEDAPLSQLVVQVLSHIPGVTTVLCGARQIDYVNDILSACQRPRLFEAKKILANLYNQLDLI